MLQEEARLNENISKELYLELYQWFCIGGETYLIPAGDFIKTMKLRGWNITLSDIKEFWETDDKVTNEYLVSVNSALYRRVHQLKPK